MSLKIAIEGNWVSARLSGVFRLADQKALQLLASKAISQGEKLRFLAVLEDFRGWEKGEDWGDIEFLLEHGNQIVKMAIVGDPVWKEDFFAFLGKGYRTTEIEFFPSDRLAEAKAWVQT